MRTKTTQKALAMLLALVMLFSLIPGAAFADDGIELAEVELPIVEITEDEEPTADPDPEPEEIPEEPAADNIPDEPVGDDALGVPSEEEEEELSELFADLTLSDEERFEATADSGTIGGATYTISEDGVLTVGSGEFTIENWASVFGTGGTSSNPNDTAMSIQSVVFQEGAVLTSTKMTKMFINWESLESADLTNLTASAITEMGHLFFGCSKLTSVTFGTGVETSKVQGMSQMFQGCSSLRELDLSTFKVYTGTGKRSLYRTFYGCSNLVSIRVSDDWYIPTYDSNGTTKDLVDGYDTFTNCNKLEGGNGTKANGWGDYSKAVIDGKDGKQGYFTSASAAVVHHHDFTSYSANGDTLTATCTLSGCDLPNNQIKLTLKAPEKTAYDDGKSAEPTFEGKDAFKAATGWNGSYSVNYYKKGSTTEYGGTPNVPGEYTVKAKISGIPGQSRYSLSVDYTIDRKEISLTWSNTEFNYDGKPHLPTAAITGLNSNRSKCGVVITGAQTEIGTYTATATELTGEDSNYYKLPDNATQQFSIVAKIGTAPYVIDNGTLTVKSGSFTGEQWIAAFANSKATITSVSFETGAVLTGSASKMFQGWTVLASVDFSHLTATDVKDMYQMFQGCVSLTELDLSAFGGYTGAGKRSLSQMFSGCSNLVTIRVSDNWNVNNAEGSDTFKGCTELIGGNGTKCPGTGDYTKAVIDTADQPGYLTSADAVVHWHRFTYSTDGKTLTATCSVDGCNLENHQITLTLKAPEKAVYDDSKSAEATLEGKDAFKTETGVSGWNTISYYKKGSSASMTAPTTPGEYTARVTISNVAGGPYELSVDYSIAQKEIGLTWGETTFHYDGKPHVPTVTATGLVGNDKCDVIVTGEQTAIGNYTATASGLSNEWYKLPENNTVEFDIEGWLGTARYTIESGKAPTKSKMLLKATNPDDDSLNDNYKMENGVLTVYSSDGISAFTRDDWRLAFANDNFIKNYRDNITRVVFSNGSGTGVKLTDSAEGMFRDWAGLESVDFTGLDTSEVTWMQNMFSGCVSLTELDLSPLNTQSVNNMAYMFYKCSALKKIVVGNVWKTASSTSHMFSGCNMLDGGAGTRYQALFGNYIYTVEEDDDDPDNPTLPDVDGKYAHLDGGKFDPGFFYNAHVHQLTYSVDPNAPWTITATCSADVCYLGDSNNHSVSISLVKPTLYVYYMDVLNKKDGEYDKGASPLATLTMQNVGDQTLQDSTTVADPDGKISGISFSVSTFNDANTAAPTFEELTGATIGEIEYYEKGSDTKLSGAPSDAGTYTAKVTIGDATASVDYRIFKRFHSPVLKSPKPNASFAFGQTAQDLITVEENAIKKVDDTDTSTFEFALGTDATTIPTSGWSKDIPKGKGAGPFYVFYRVAGDKNHGNALEAEFPSKTGYAITDNPDDECNSYKPAYSVIVISYTLPTPPTPNELTYNGQGQALVEAGSATIGKMQYALGEIKTDQPLAEQGDTKAVVIAGIPSHVWKTGEWSDTVPQKTEPGVYYVLYRVVSNDNTQAQIGDIGHVMVTLGKADLTVTPPTATATYGQTLAKVSLTNPTENPEGTWTWVNPGTSVGNVGTKTFKAKFTPTDKTHYKTVEVDVTVTVSKADPTANAPSVNATYGQTLADVTLSNPKGNTPGTWTWANADTSVGDVGQKVFKANFTPNDIDNYNSKNNVTVTVNVGKAANPATVNATAAVKTSNTINLVNNVDRNDATGAVSYEISGNANGCTLSEGSLSAGDSIGTVIVNVTIAADEHYEALPTTPITVTISAKKPQTISADNVTVTYGDTDKKVSASVTEGGAISYAVKSGSEKYIAIDAEGNLTIKAVPLTGDKAYVTVTAEETHDYAETTKEVTVTIKRADTTVTTTPAKKELTYTGSPLELVTAGTATAGQMRYALGTETAASGTYSASIPTATDAGTYYVWYYAAVGDNNHNDSTPDCVKVTIDKADPTVTAPTAKTLTWSGSAQALVTAGEAEGGTMQYATGTDASTAPTDGWSETIPTGTEVGTYYVWYKVIGDENHTNTDPACVPVTMLEKKYTITYNANGGKNAPAAQEKTHGETIKLSAEKPTHENDSREIVITLNPNGGSVSVDQMTAIRTYTYTFRRWNTRSNGAGTNYAAGASYAENADATLYAQWRVSAASNPARLELPAPEREGYTFTGWALSKNGTSPTMSTVIPTYGHTRYAQWEINQYTVTFDTGDGGTEIAPITQDYGTAITPPADPTREGYTFKGWVPALPATMPAENMTVKAQWEINHYTVSYDANGVTGTMTDLDYKHGDTVTVLANAFTVPKNHSFAGWNTSADGSGMTYQADDTFTITEDTVLYAQWSRMEVKFSSSLSLADSFKLRLYIYGLEDYEGLTVSWEKKDGTQEDHLVTEGAFNPNYAGGAYIFEIEEFNATEMLKEIPVTVKDQKGEELGTAECSVNRYCELVFEKSQDEKLKTLCQAVVDYGTYAQRYFNVDTDKVPNPNADATALGTVPEDYKLVFNNACTGITSGALSLALESKPNLNVYFNLASGYTAANYEVTAVSVSGEDLKPTVTMAGSAMIVTIPEIAVINLGKSMTVTVRNTKDDTVAVFNGSALSYAYMSRDDASKHDVVRGLYDYYLKAIAYFS